MYAEGIGNFHFSGAKKQDTGFPHCPVLLLSHTCLPLSIVLLPNLSLESEQLPQQFQLFLFGECGFKFKSFRVLLTDQNPPAYEKSPPYIPMVRPPDNHDEAAQVLDRGNCSSVSILRNWQRMFLSSNAQTAPCCNHESVQSGSADRSVMGSGTNVQLLGVQKRIPVIDSSGLPDLACLCFFQAATFPAARLTDYRNTKPLFVKPRSQKQKSQNQLLLFSWF